MKGESWGRKPHGLCSHPMSSSLSSLQGDNICQMTRQALSIGRSRVGVGVESHMFFFVVFVLPKMFPPLQGDNHSQKTRHTLWAKRWRVEAGVENLMVLFPPKMSPSLKGNNHS